MVLLITDSTTCLDIVASVLDPLNTSPFSLEACNEYIPLCKSHFFSNSLARILVIEKSDLTQKVFEIINLRKLSQLSNFLVNIESTFELPNIDDIS